MIRRAALASLVLLAGCAGGKMVRIPSHDRTPPAAALEARGPADSLRLAAGGEGGQVELAGTDSLVLTGTARDEGGVREMALIGKARVICGDPATGATWSRTTAFQRRHVPGSPRVTHAPARRDARFVLRPGDLAKACRGGELRGAVGSARFLAADYGGGSSHSPLLEFRLAVSEVAAQAIEVPGTVPGPAAATGFGPQPGLGGSGGDAGPRRCPLPAASGLPAGPKGMSGESVETGGGSGPGGDAMADPECRDAPVPSLSPPSRIPKSSRIDPARQRRAQIPQIGASVAPGI